MKRFFDWQVVLGLVLIILSAAFYLVHYLVFRNAHEIVSNLFENMAFVFIQVLLVTLVLNRLLTVREKRSLLKKMNMVIGAFFSEVGTDLIRFFRAFDADANGMAEHLVVTAAWSGADFLKARQRASTHAYSIDAKQGDLPALKAFLVSKRQFLLSLLENPNLLEHESFTNLLWAVFHLTEELANRKDLAALPPSDSDHIAIDIKRSYAHLTAEWLAYMEHLKSDYPYLFSLAVRTNPFDPNASITVK